MKQNEMKMKFFCKRIQNPMMIKEKKREKTAETTLYRHMLIDLKKKKKPNHESTREKIE